MSNHDTEQPLVVMQGITKAYPGVLANDEVALTLHAGRIHALLGENGAGKSTLVKVLYGLLTPDSGTIHWRGEQVVLSAPVAARQLGIAMVFQHFSLFESLTVLENIALGMGADANEQLRERIVELSNRYGLSLDPSRSVYSLSVGARQRIEIVRCLLQDPHLLIMDEPTSVLTPQEVASLFETLKTLADKGVAILYISHKLEEIRALCSEATVLRAGRNVAEVDPRVTTAASLAALMIGTELPSPSQKAHSRTSKQVFSLNSLNALSNDINEVSLHDVDLTINAGEIVGIAGVAGNGQDELLQVIAGERLADSSQTIMLDGQAIGRFTAGKRRRLGLCCVPEERLGHAAVPTLSLVENVFLTAHQRQPLQIAGLISHRRCSSFAERIIKQFDVRCQGPQALASSLSGGNLQKFIVGREILQSPQLLVVAQPTWGVDAGAASVIHEAIADLARQGAAILVISQDLDELMLTTDRIGALCAGKLSAFYPTGEISAQQVGLLMGGESLPETLQELDVVTDADSS